MLTTEMQRKRSYNRRSTAEDVTAGLDLAGRTALITGSTSGIGYETMRVLVRHGAHVLGLGRDGDKCRVSCDAVMRDGGNGRATPLVCDQTDYDSVVACAEEVRRLGRPIDMLICNAGLNVPSLERVNGIEKHFAVHHLSHFILVNRLLDLVTAASQGRIVMVSSIMYKDAPECGIDFENLTGDRYAYNWRRMYGQSKLANGLFARELAGRVRGSNATANVLHPGNIIGTNITSVWRRDDSPAHMKIALTLQPMLRPFLKTVSQGAATTCYVATDPELSLTTGAYFEDCQRVMPGGHMTDDVLAARLWSLSEELTGKYLR